jgi:hypothetical protein
MTVSRTVQNICLRKCLFSATRSVDKGRPITLPECGQEEVVPQATWFKDGAETLISTSSHMHHSLVFFARPISQFLFSEFIFSYSSPPKVGTQVAFFKRETNQATLPKDGIHHNSSATCSPEIEQRSWFIRGGSCARVSIISS